MRAASAAHRRVLTEPAVASMAVRRDRVEVLLSSSLQEDAMRRHVVCIVLAALALGGLAACGPAAVSSTAKRPARIVSLSPTATETLFALGAAKQVVAVDNQSNFPVRAPRTSLSSYRPNAEAIAGYRPDLVVMSSGAVADQLRALRIKVLVLPAAKTLDESYSEIRELGKATGRGPEAKALVQKTRDEIAKITTEVPKRRQAPAAYYEIDSTFFSADSTTFIGQLLKLAGLRNIADQATKASSGYPQLSAEHVVQANPAVIFLADTKCCGQTLAKVAARPSFAQIQAVRDGHVVELDDDIASRWGPRVVDLYRQVVDATKGL
jgi:iron complex transport system substrate-binding protein